MARMPHAFWKHSNLQHLFSVDWADDRMATTMQVFFSPQWHWQREKMFITGAEVSSHSQMHTLEISDFTLRLWNCIVNFIFGGHGIAQNLSYWKNRSKSLRKLMSNNPFNVSFMKLEIIIYVTKNIRNANPV